MLLFTSSMRVTGYSRIQPDINLNYVCCLSNEAMTTKRYRVTRFGPLEIDRVSAGQTDTDKKYSYKKKRLYFKKQRNRVIITRKGRKKKNDVMSCHVMSCHVMSCHVLEI